MTKLPKEKRDRITLIAVVTLMVMAGLWFSLIAAQDKQMMIIERQTTDERKRVDDAEKRVKSKDKVETELNAVTQELKTQEDGMAVGDLFGWFYNRLNNFRGAYRVEIIDIKDQQLGDVKLLPDFPYKAVTFKVNMAGYYHDLGKFLADFENNFPYMRVQNILIKPAETSSPEDPEKLSCKMEIVLLRRQAATTP
jgi:Tfp pilus assembly protein PilO